MYSTIALGILFGIFHQGSSTNEYIVRKSETVRNISVAWNWIHNGTIGAVITNSHIEQPSEEQVFRSSNKTTNSYSTKAISPLYQASNTNLTNFDDLITSSPIKSALRFFGKCNKSFKFCQKACRHAYKETCKDFECEDGFKVKMKENCDTSCDKALENAPR